MNLLYKKVIRIPREHVAHIFCLWDNCRDGSRLADYKLWDAVSQIVPETNIGKWQLHKVDSLTLVVRKKLWWR